MSRNEMIKLVLEDAQRKIRSVAGNEGYKVVAYDGKVDDKIPPQVLPLIAKSLNQSAYLYRVRSNEGEVVELKQIAAYILYKTYRNLSYNDIARLVGFADHTLIVHHFKKVRNYLHVKDEKFVPKYKKAFKAVRQWLEETS